jgi:hypothetical protein
MAEVCSGRSTPLPNSINRCSAEEENESIFCYKLKQELDLTLQELSSAKKNYSDTSRRKNSTPNLDVVSTGEDISGLDINFEIVTPKSGRDKLTSNKGEYNNIRKMQQKQSIPAAVDKYSTLASLQVDQVASQKRIDNWFH